MTERTRASYDRIAQQYAERLGDELAGKPLDRALLAALAELSAAPVLDVGGGPGHVAAHLVAQGATVVHTDLSPQMCGIAGASGLPSVAADMTALPFASGSVGGIVCLYAVIHLDSDQRAAACGELRRVLRAGGTALIAFHTRDASTPVGGRVELETWWDEPVALTFRFLDPAEELELLRAAELTVTARLDRAPGADEHASERTYLLAQRPG